MTIAFSIALAQLIRSWAISGKPRARPRCAAEAHAAGAGLIFSASSISPAIARRSCAEAGVPEGRDGPVEAFAKDTADGGPAVLIGTPWLKDGGLYNAVAYLDSGAVQATSFKGRSTQLRRLRLRNASSSRPMPGPFNIRACASAFDLRRIWGFDPSNV